MKRNIYLKVEYGEAYDAEKPYNLVVDNDLEIDSSKHLNYCIGTIRHWEKQRVRVVTLPYMYAKSWLEEHHSEVLILSISLSDLLNSFWLEKYKNEFYMITSAGNEGDRGETGLATKPYWTAIGAVSPYLNHKSYSSFGGGHVKYVGITGIPISYYDAGDWRTETRKVTSNGEGTSYSVDQHGTQVYNMCVAFYQKFGREIRLQEVLATISKYVKDIDKVGFDLKTGHGYYEYREGEFVMNFGDVKGHWVEKDALMLKEMGIINGFTDGTLKPDEKLTRAECIAMIARLVKYLKSTT